MTNARSSARSFSSVEEAFTYYTEVNLATLGELAMLKSTSASRLKRQSKICLGMLYQCWFFDLRRTASSNKAPRTMAILEEVQSGADLEKSLSEALGRYETKIKQT